MKRLLSFLLAAMLLTATAGAVDLYVDTARVSTDTPPTVVDGRTLVPLRVIFESLGAAVEWNNDTRTATGTKDGAVISIQIDNSTAYVNGAPHTLDVPAQLINNRTMVPARFVSEAFGCQVSWDQDTQTAAVANNLRGQYIYCGEGGTQYHFKGTCDGGALVEITLAEAMGRGLAACGTCVPDSAANTVLPGTTANGLDLTGTWVQTGSSGIGTSQIATIKDGVIEVYWYTSDGMMSLYWAGNYDAPGVMTNSFSWESTRDTTRAYAASVLAPDTDTKTFTYDNGRLSYEVNLLGRATTFVLTRKQ